MPVLLPFGCEPNWPQPRSHMLNWCIAEPQWYLSMIKQIRLSTDPSGLWFSEKVWLGFRAQAE